MPAPSILLYIFYHITARVSINKIFRARLDNVFAAWYNNKKSMRMYAKKICRES